MSRNRGLSMVALLVPMLTACAPAVDTVRLSPVRYPPRPHDFRIRMYSTERPRCLFEEIGTVCSRKPAFWVSMADVAESVRDVARELGGDAIIGVTNGTQLNGGTVVGSTVTIDTDPVLSGMVIRFKDDECRE
jgi:hypothetical protein